MSTIVPPNPPPPIASLYPPWVQGFIIKIRKGCKNSLEMQLRYDVAHNPFVYIHIFFIRYRIVAVDNNVMAFSDQAFHEEPVIIFTNPQHARFPAPQKVTSTHIRYRLHVKQCFIHLSYQESTSYLIKYWYL